MICDGCTCKVGEACNKPVPVAASRHVHAARAGDDITIRIGDSQRYHLSDEEARALRADLDRLLGGPRS